MNFNSFKKLVEEAKKDHPVWFGIESDKYYDAVIVSEAEVKLGSLLPDDYKNFIKEYGGGYFGFSNVYSLEQGSDWNLVDLNYQYNNFRDCYVLFSENGSGDFYGFKSNDGICESNVCFYDHESQAWQLTKFKNLFEYLAIFALKK